MGFLNLYFVYEIKKIVLGQFLAIFNWDKPKNWDFSMIT